MAEMNREFIHEEGEVHIATYRTTFVSFLAYFLWGFIIFGTALAVILAGPDSPKEFKNVGVPGLALYLIFIVLLFGLPIAYMITNRLHLTDRRLIWRIGVFGKPYCEVNLRDMRDLSYKKLSIGGFLFNYGNIYFETAGSTIDRIKFPSVAKPKYVIATIQKQMDLAKGCTWAFEKIPVSNKGKIYCPNCGMVCLEGDQFCRKCGNRLVASTCDSYSDSVIQ